MVRLCCCFDDKVAVVVAPNFRWKETRGKVVLLVLVITLLLLLLLHGLFRNAGKR